MNWFPHDVLTGIEVDRKSTRLNSSHSQISYAVFCLKKNIQDQDQLAPQRGVGLQLQQVEQHRQHVVPQLLLLLALRRALDALDVLAIPEVHRRISVAR